MSHRFLRSGPALPIAMLALATAIGTSTFAVAQPKGGVGASKGAKTTPATASASASASASPTPAAAPKDDVETWFAQGAAAHKAGRFAEAEELFLKAWAVKKAWDVAANLGLAQVNLGKHVDAAEHLAYALQWFPASEPAETKAVLQRRLDAARAEIGAVLPTVDVAGADVRVNGVSKGVSPLASEVFVAPGAVTIDVAKDGYKPAHLTFDIAKGGKETPQIQLVPETAPERSKVPAYVMGGVGIASLVAAGVLIGVAESTRAGLADEAPRGADGQLLCWKSPSSGGATKQCDDWRAKLSTTSAEGNAGIGLFIAGGALVAGAAAYWLWPAGGAPSKSGSSKVVPVVGPTFGGAMWTGNF